MNKLSAARLAELHAALAEVYRGLAESDPAGHDNVVGLRDAAARLGVTRSWLCRRENWQGAGGFKAPDGRVKFTLSVLSAFANTRKH